MSFWAIAAVYVVGTVLQWLLRPRPSHDYPPPATLSEITAPQIGEGQPVPWAAGTVEIRGGSTVWYGDLDTQRCDYGWKYYLGLQIVLCSGPYVNVLYPKFNRNKAWPYTVTTDPSGNWINFAVDSPHFFTGNSEDGGIVGDIRFYLGTAAQLADDYLQSVISPNMPGYRGICYAVIRGAYLGLSPQIPAFSAVIERIPNRLGLGEILHAYFLGYTKDANPAEMIYDILTAPPNENGLGLQAGVIDTEAFLTVGNALKAENFGLSLVQDQGTTGKEMILEILRHIDAVKYDEPTTGLTTIKLIRFDYDPDDLPVLDESNCKVTSFTRPDWTELRNTVRVKYVSRTEVGTEFVEKVATAQDLAAIQRAGGQIVSQDFEYKGISQHDTAQLVAARLLKSLSYPLGSMTIEASRVAWAFRPGTVFKLNYPPYGIEGLICRVLKPRTGILTDGKISIDAIEDVFSVDWTVFSAPPDSAWVDPAADVPELQGVAGFEPPYPYRPYVETSGHTALALAARGRGMTLGFRIYKKLMSGLWETKGIPAINFTPSGLLAAGIDELSASIVVSEGPDTRTIETKTEDEFGAGANLLWIEDGAGYGEFVAFKTAIQGTGLVTLSDLARGCIDTLPKAHLAGARVWFVSYGFSRVGVNSPVSPATSLDTDLRFQAYNQQDEIELASAPVATVKAVTPKRKDRPYSASEVKINGASYPVSIAGELALSWSHRNRLDVWSYATSGRTTWAEPGTTYEVTVWGEEGTIIKTVTGLSGTSWTYPEADEITDSGLGRLNNHLKVRLETKVSAYAVEYFEWEFDRV